MMVSYRMDGAAGSIFLASVGDLQLAFNRIVQRLKLEPEKVSRHVRLEGTVKIERKKYPAIMQAGLVVIEGQVDIPDRIELKC